MKITMIDGIRLDTDRFWCDTERDYIVDEFTLLIPIRDTHIMNLNMDLIRYSRNAGYHMLFNALGEHSKKNDDGWYDYWAMFNKNSLGVPVMESCIVARVYSTPDDDNDDTYIIQIDQSNILELSDTLKREFENYYNSSIEDIFRYEEEGTDDA